MEQDRVCLKPKARDLLEYLLVLPCPVITMDGELTYQWLIKLRQLRILIPQRWRSRSVYQQRNSDQWSVGQGREGSRRGGRGRSWWWISTTSIGQVAGCSISRSHFAKSFQNLWQAIISWMCTSFLREDIKTSSHHKNEGHISQYESQIQGEGRTNLRDRRGKLSQHLSRTCPDLLGLTHPPLASCSRYSCNGSDLSVWPLTHWGTQELVLHTKLHTPILALEHPHQHQDTVHTDPLRARRARCRICGTNWKCEVTCSKGIKAFFFFQSLSLDLSWYILSAISCGTPSSRDILTRWVWTLPRVQGTTQDQAVQSRALRTHLREAGKRRDHSEQRHQAPRRRLRHPSNFAYKTQVQK